MTALVILPGLDGTGTMHASFASALDELGPVTALAYPADKTLDYADIEAWVRRRLPMDSPFILLGESFSGPVAISIAAAPPPNLVGLVLSTSFSETPLRASPLFAWLVGIVPVARLPGFLLAPPLLGRWSTPTLLASLQHALRLVSPLVLRHRAATALRANVSSRLGAIGVPVLCLRATRDRLVPYRCVRRMTAAIADCTLIEIDGPHLLLQAVPTACARAVSSFAQRCTGPFRASVGLTRSPASP